MMMKKRLLITTTLLTSLSSPSLLAAEQSPEQWLPKVYGDVRAQAQAQSDTDFETEIYQANLGLLGLYRGDTLNVRYHTRLQYSDNYKDSTSFNDVELMEANLVVFHKRYGGFFIGEGTTGTWKDLYSRVDIHESNSMEPSSQGHLFEQAKYGHNQLAYFTPKFNGDWGTLWFKVAVITPNDGNGHDADIVGLRALYHGDNFNLVINRAQVDEKMLPTDEDYVRWAIATDYSWNNWTLAALVELNEESVKKVDATYAAALSYSWSQWDFGLSYQFKTYEDEANKEDQSLTIASAKYHLDRHITLFAEGALYKEDPETISGRSDVDNNINLGFIFKF